MNSISNQITKGIVQAIVLLTLIALLLFFIYKIQSVFVYIIISFVLTLMGLPLLKFLKSKAKFSNLWATIATLFLYILMIVGFISMFIPLITSQSESLSLLNTVDIEKNVKALLESVDKYLKIQGIHIENLVSEKDVTSRINLNYLPDILNGLLNTISSFGMGLASILFITFFFLKDSAKISRGLEFVLPKNFKNRLVTSWETIENLLSRYFLGIIIQLSIVFVLYIIVLSIFGVKNALIISFLCAVLNIIPYIGPLMGMILAAILTLISGLDTDFQSENLPTTLYVMIGFMLVQIIDNNLNQPLIFSNSVKSHPLEIFLAILIAGFVFGVVGMIVAVPVYTIIKVILKTFWPESKIVQILTKEL